LTAVRNVYYRHRKPWLSVSVPVAGIGQGGGVARSGAFASLAPAQPCVVWVGQSSLPFGAGASYAFVATFGVLSDVGLAFVRRLAS
jgi:hypothetical protein